MKSIIGIFIVLMFALWIGSVEVNSAHADVINTATPTISSPKTVFSIGYSSSSGASYLPRKGEICRLKHDINASYLGTLRPTRSMLIIKFTSDAYAPLAANFIECEAASQHTPNDRRSWYLSQPGFSGYNILNSDAAYIDGQTLLEVTLTSTVTPSITKSATATVTEVLDKTATPFPAPIPTIHFSTDTGQSVYIPKKNDICWSWNELYGRIGYYAIPLQKQLLVVKFLSDQSELSVNSVNCENDENGKPEERASWANNKEPGYYPWSKIVSYYIGDDMAVVTLTLIPSITNTPSVTSTSTATGTPTETTTSTPTETEIPSVTKTPTIDRSKITPSNTRTRTSTMTFTPSKTSTKTSTPTRTATRTATPVLKADWEIGILASTVIKPKKGDICWGRFIGSYSNVAVQFTKTYNFGVLLRGPGGCIKSNYYSLNSALTFLNRKGIVVKGIYLPDAEPTATITVIPNLPIDWQTSTRSKFWAGAGTICWGDKVANFEYKVVNFTKDSKSDFWVLNGGCYIGGRYSSEDIYNYLKRIGKPINGIVNAP